MKIYKGSKKIVDTDGVIPDKCQPSNQVNEIVILRVALEQIASNEVYQKYPSGDADFSELGRYIWPERIKYLQDIAKNTLKAI